MKPPVLATAPDSGPLPAAAPGLRALVAGACLAAFACLGCSSPGDRPSAPGDATPALPAGSLPAGNGYVHYHPYPDTGQAFCGVGLDFASHGMMVAAASPSIHAALADDSLCARTRYARVTCERTGRQVTVAILDKGGVALFPWKAREQHVMDLSERAFDLLDEGGVGRHAGRIYVTWEILPPSFRP